jgi:hypothetical protein
MQTEEEEVTHDEIIEMARQAGFHLSMWQLSLGCDANGTLDELEAFAKLVAAKATEKANARANASWTLMCEKMVAFEREACAKVCDDKHDTWRWDDEPDSASGPRDCAAAIRARGES